ncbi:hypothetical protein [Actinotalea caeni]|uniref:hypothetical protein n=2 Tax=Actinotalea caeni TaxID=1348467 RepID=UPI001F047362|nr:hypothetical protein [Actinotalea caeni]
MVAMEGFWDFASHYWWLLFVFGGPIGAAVTGIAKHLRKASERRAELKLERYRIQQQYKHGKAIEAADAETSRQAFVAATQRLMDTHDEVNRRWLAYELDAVRLLEYPLMTDMREEVTVAFHRARRLADSLRPEEAAHVTDRETQREYRDAVTAYASAFDVAEAEAKRVRQGGFSTDERARIATALKLLRLALDDAASPEERQSAYQRVRREIDGLIVLPTGATDAVEERITRELPRA